MLFASLIFSKFFGRPLFFIDFNFLFSENEQSCSKIVIFDTFAIRIPSVEHVLSTKFHESRSKTAIREEMAIFDSPCTYLPIYIKFVVSLVGI